MDKDLKALTKSKYGKDARQPTVNLFENIQQLNVHALTERIQLMDIVIALVVDATTNQEVVDARGNYQLLHEHLDEVELQINYYKENLEIIKEANKLILEGGA